MKKLLSLPPSLVSQFHEVEKAGTDEYFCASDPQDRRLGSGGGTCWLLRSCHEATEPQLPFDVWLAREKRVLLHAGGQSRRLPAYAPVGKVLTPIPVFRWARGQRISQNLLQLQLPLYESILEAAPSTVHTLVASGDVFVRLGRLPDVPEADVVVYGVWADPALASRHGVFVSSPTVPQRLIRMLQKPSVREIASLLPDHQLLLDTGIWLLSDRAVEVLMRRSVAPDGQMAFYDMYGTFGLALGDSPALSDPDVAALSVAVVPLRDGEFYHFGTSRELTGSTLALQNLVPEGRQAFHVCTKPHPSIFIQNSHSEVCFTPDNQNIWIENSCVGRHWTLSHSHIITGVPQNDWQITLPAGVCVDVVPWGELEYVLRPYGFDDDFSGSLADSSTRYLGISVSTWLSAHGLRAEDFEGSADIQYSALFPIVSDVRDMEPLLRWMLTGEGAEGEALYRRSAKVSAGDLGNAANASRLAAQRQEFLKENLSELAVNHRFSVFYQTDLGDMARQFSELGVPVPAELDEGEPLLKRVSDQMFRSQLQRLQERDGILHERQAFSLLRHALVADAVSQPQNPYRAVSSDQIVWSRSPLRIDLAGGWTDTPPFCLTDGGNVVNVAVELNGQPPLQAYVKCSARPQIILRSIDLGAQEVVTTYDGLADFARVGSPFSIPKAALALAGFLPRFSQSKYKTLADQLRAFGCGLEVTLLSAVPAGSGMGTSSLLASTVLAAVSDFCGLSWDRAEVCRRTLVLEQMLTTGGGWQDQYGGVMPGLKLLRTSPGCPQTPVVHWLPDSLFTDATYSPCHLLYYTGITRTAKKILSEIVRGMFLADNRTLALLARMKEHALQLHEVIMQGDFSSYGRLVGKTWVQNQLLDSGTCPPEVQAIIDRVSPLCLGLKLPGAGGGGFLYMVARDPQAAARIRQLLTSAPLGSRARFVDMKLSKSGLQTSRS